MARAKASGPVSSTTQSSPQALVRPAARRRAVPSAYGVGPVVGDRDALEGVPLRELGLVVDVDLADLHVLI